VTDLKKTPLYDAHLKLGGKMVEFGGWLMPVQYSGIIEEHQAVRTKAGLFDVSHMGEIEITGPGALAMIQNLITNDAAKLSIGQAIYSPMCYEDGGIVDDLLVYRLEEEKYWLVVNAGNKDKDYEWIIAHQGEKALAKDISAQTGQIALQGPLAQEILASVVKDDLASLRYYHFVKGLVADCPAIISRTGYTGEDGFEIYLSADDAPKVWDALLTAGKDKGLVPAGLGARDTLRFEAKFPLYGHELDDKTTPLEAVLGIFVDLNKEEFIGREVLKQQKSEGVSRKLVGFRMIDRGIPRAGYEIEKDGVAIGTVTSGSYAPTLEMNLGLGYVRLQDAVPENEIQVVIRGKSLRAQIIKTPFYKRTAK